MMFNVPFISPFAWASGAAVTPSNTNPTRRFSVGRSATRFTADGSGRAFTGSDGQTLFSTDGTGTRFTDGAGSRFTGDGE